jgi:hypothetical protein
MSGQFTLPSGSAVSLITGTVANVLSPTIAAGLYLVWGRVNFGLSAATMTNAQAAVSLTSATMPTQAGGSGLGPDAITIVPLLVTLLTDTFSVECGPTMLTLVAPTTVYLCAKTTFSLGSMTAYGTLSILPMLGASFDLTM